MGEQKIARLRSNQHELKQEKVYIKLNWSEEKLVLAVSVYSTEKRLLTIIVRLRIFMGNKKDIYQDEVGIQMIVCLCVNIHLFRCT